MNNNTNGVKVLIPAQEQENVAFFQDAMDTALYVLRVKGGKIRVLKRNDAGFQWKSVEDLFARDVKDPFSPGSGYEPKLSSKDLIASFTRGRAAGDEFFACSNVKDIFLVMKGVCEG